jgi:hypothetical protein
MAELQDREMTGDDDYDEDADSDFDVQQSGADELSSGSDSDEQDASDARPRKRQKLEKPAKELITELDSGDEATIQEQKKPRKNAKSQGDAAAEDNGEESEGWRARTRAMRNQEKEERRKKKLASSKGSTIDVDKIWQEMNQSTPLTPPRVEDQMAGSQEERSKADVTIPGGAPIEESEKENVPVVDDQGTITIKRTYKFAGEVHVEEKTVLKSSAEARLWLAQNHEPTTDAPDGNAPSVNRPLRKISRFDPNISNMDAFRGSWAAVEAQKARFKGPKLNVVEKSKMDWAAHVDSEGLKEELDVHAKAKEGYLTRMDFLKDVEERKEAEARAARLKGR